MIYDCFMFFNELDLLEIRLEELAPVVDAFVLVESTRTHSGKSKPLYFDRSRDRYRKFANKIVHHIVDDMPSVANGDRWPLENHQRDAIGHVLRARGCAPNDIILISDVDEIPRASRVAALQQVLAEDDVAVFEQQYFRYYVDLESKLRWRGTVACRYREIQRCGSINTVRTGDTTRQRASVLAGAPGLEDTHPLVEDGGWTFTSFGGRRALLYKLQSFAHAEADYSAECGTADVDDYVRTGSPPDSDTADATTYDPRLAGLPAFLVQHRTRFAYFFDRAAACDDEMVVFQPAFGEGGFMRAAHSFATGRPRALVRLLLPSPVHALLRRLPPPARERMARWYLQFTRSRG